MKEETHEHISRKFSKININKAKMKTKTTLCYVLTCNLYVYTNSFLTYFESFKPLSHTDHLITSFRGRYFIVYVTNMTMAMLHKSSQQHFSVPFMMFSPHIFWLNTSVHSSTKRRKHQQTYRNECVAYKRMLNSLILLPDKNSLSPDVLSRCCRVVFCCSMRKYCCLMCFILRRQEKDVHL